MRLQPRLALSFILLLAFGFSVSAQPEPLKIVASFSILADVVQNVAGETAVVTSLIPLGADPHTFEPSARDIATLEDADIIFIAGANFEETLLNAILSVGAAAEIAEASACVNVRDFGDDPHDHDDDHGHDDADDDHAHDDDHGHDDDKGAFGLDLEALCDSYHGLLNDWDAANGGSAVRVATAHSDDYLFEDDCGHDDHDDDHDADDDHSHDHDACDPHVWSDPRNISLWTLYIRDTLSAAVPANREIYAENADAYLKALDALVRLELEPLLANIPAERRVLMTNHETIGYFAAAYGFEQAGFVLRGGSSMAEPSAQALAALIDRVRAENIPAIFSENTISARVAEQIAAETGVQNYTLYTDSLSDAGGEAATTLDYIAYNFRTIAAALTPR